MTEKERICVFSISNRDRFCNIKQTIDWLRNEGKDLKYYFNKWKPKSELRKGSIVLFSFEGQIFGQARVKEDIKEISLEDQREQLEKVKILYNYSITFEGASIEIFRYYPTKKEIGEKFDIQFSQLFTYIDSNYYEEILRRARMQR